MSTDIQQYIHHLKEIFDNCGQVGDGKIGALELRDLCKQLMIEDKYDILSSHILSDERPRISFTEFKEGFVTVLSDIPDIFTDPKQQDLQEKIVEEVSPKLVRGGKSYGRKSKPLEDETDQPVDETIADRNVVSPNTDTDHGLDPGQADHLKNIWKELGVGESGYLDLAELSLVCSHIGMDEMNQEELQNLFEKLDADHDKKISFAEFLAGLFLHGNGTPVSSRSRSTPPALMTVSDKLTAQIRRIQLNETKITAEIPLYSSSGVFTELDREGTGEATGEDVVEFWKQAGLDSSALGDILGKMEYRLDSLIPLDELTTKLNEHMASEFGQNAGFSALFFSYQKEVKHLRNLLDRHVSEHIKLQSAFSDLNVRNTLLVQEMEERQTAMETSFQAKVESIEESWAERQQNLQKEFELEREHWMVENFAESARASEIDTKLQNENRLLTQELDQGTKKNQGLQHELISTAERLVSLEKANFKLQQDLEQALVDRSEFDAREANRELMMQEQIRMTNQKIASLETDNKALRDKSDELMSELEMFSDQGFPRRRPARRRSTGGSRHGSVLSKYAKPAVPLHREPSPSDDEEGRPSSRKSILNTVDTTLTELRQQHREEIVVLEGKLEEQRTQNLIRVEEMVAEEKQRHEQQLKVVKEDFEREKEQLTSDYEMVQDKLLTEIRNSLKAQHETELIQMKAAYVEKLDELEKTSSLLRANVEKVTLAETFDIGCSPLPPISPEQRPKADVSVGSDIRLDLEVLERAQRDDGDLQKTLREEFEHRFTLDKDALIEQYENEKSELIRNYQIEMADLRHQIDGFQTSPSAGYVAPPSTVQQDDLVARFQEEKAQLIKKHQLQIAEYEHMLTLGESGLSGQLKDDFDKLLELHKSSWEGEEMDKVLETQRQFEATHQERMAELRAHFDQERHDLELGYETHIQSLMERFEKEMEENETEIKTDLERNFTDELARLKRLHSAELESAANDYRLLQDQLSRLQNQYRAEVNEVERSHSRLEEDDALRQSIDQLTEQNSEMVDAKTRLETELETLKFELRLARSELESVKDDYEQRIAQLNIDIANARSHVKVDSFSNEKEHLERENTELQTQLKSTHQKLLEVNAALSVSDSQHQRNIQQLEEKLSKLIDPTVHEGVQQQLDATKSKLENLESLNKTQSQEHDEKLDNLVSDHAHKLIEIEDERDESVRKIAVLRSSYNELLSKYKTQLERTSRAGFLCKDLYVENSQLMGAVQITEEREKDAHQQNFSLEDRNRAIQRLLSRVCQAATYDYQ